LSGQKKRKIELTFIVASIDDNMPQHQNWRCLWNQQGNIKPVQKGSSSETAKNITNTQSVQKCTMHTTIEKVTEEHEAQPLHPSKQQQQNILSTCCKRKRLN